MAHLYLHVPFCARRCSYCDFSIAVRRRIPAGQYVEAIRAVGVERSFVSSDLGQLTTPFPPDGLAMAAKALRANGFTERELDILFKENPARILGLPVTAPR